MLIILLKVYLKKEYLILCRLAHVPSIPNSKHALLKGLILCKRKCRSSYEGAAIHSTRDHYSISFVNVC